ncbi:GatB/YqeY [Mycolicibacterium sp.]|uniref:GatB/YqeY n=1 Tax=Mycolicibacterium sp. TaxID=2320850 RepID=UPI003D104B3D
MTGPAERWRAEVRRELLAARTNRDVTRVSVLRSAMSAIDNAETPGGVVPSAGAIADSASGLGAAEVTRRMLGDDEIRAVIDREIDERSTAAEQFDAAGHGGRAAALRAEAAVLRDLRPGAG